jgi:hypothetical protein
MPVLRRAAAMRFSGEKLPKQESVPKQKSRAF